MNIGYIYKITNTVNGKCYVGQTTRRPEERWSQHKTAAFHENKEAYNYPLCKAIRKYGIDNFKFEVIEQCEISDLDDKEIYWIRFFNSCKNGYNQSKGGKGNHTLNIDEDSVIQKYKELQTLTKTAEYFSCSCSSIKKILNKHNIIITSAQKHAKNKSLELHQLDEQHNVIHTYQSCMDAGRKFFNAGYTNASDARHAAYSIRFAAIHDTQAYGYYWCIPRYTQEQKQYFKNKDIINQKKVYQNQKPQTITCPICGGEMLHSSKKCKKCAKRLRNIQLAERLAKLGITRDKLKCLIRTTPFVVIAKQYNVTDNTVRKWCQKFDLPTKSSEIKKYTDEEWAKI